MRVKPAKAASIALIALSVPPASVARAEIVLLKNGTRLAGDIVITYDKGLLFREKEGSPGRYYPYDEVSRITTADGILYYLMPRGGAPPPEKRSGFFPLARMLLSRGKKSAPIPCLEPPKGEAVRVDCEGADDAVTLVLKGGGRVRLLGVDPPPPSLGAEAARRATRYAADRVRGREVLLFPGPQSAERAGHPEAYVSLDRRLLNGEMIEKGWACASPLPPAHPYREAFDSLQRYAKNLGFGIWGPRAP